MHSFRCPTYCDERNLFSEFVATTPEGWDQLVLIPSLIGTGYLPTWVGRPYKWPVDCLHA